MCANICNRRNAQPPPELAKGKQRERVTRGYWEGQEILTPTFVRSSNQMANKRRLHTVYACKLKIPHQLISGAAAYWAVCASHKVLTTYLVLTGCLTAPSTNDKCLITLSILELVFRYRVCRKFISNFSRILFIFSISFTIYCEIRKCFDAVKNPIAFMKFL